MRLNKNFYIIRISKNLQKDKRNKLTYSTSGYLGIKYSEESNGSGFVVMFVEEDSPAFNAGLKANDIITAVNGIKISTYDQLLTIVTGKSPGTEIELSYINSLSLYKKQISTKKIVLGEKPLKLDIPVNSQDFRFNLQFGEIVEAGAATKEIFPAAIVGDVLLVHHLVEYKERTENDLNWNDWHLLEDDENYEYRFVQAEKEVLGIWSPNEPDASKAIIPYPKYVFCHPSFEKASIQLTAAGLWIPEKWEQSMEELTQKLDELKAQIEEMNTNSVMMEKETEKNENQKSLIRKAIDSINSERRIITRKMHQTKLVDARVVFVSDRTEEEYGCKIERGQTIICDYAMLYPLDIMGSKYVLIQAPYIEAIKN